MSDNRIDVTDALDAVQRYGYSECAVEKDKEIAKLREEVKNLKDEVNRLKTENSGLWAAAVRSYGILSDALGVDLSGQEMPAQKALRGEGGE